METIVRKTENQILREYVEDICHKVKNQGLSPMTATEVIFDRFSHRFRGYDKGRIEDAFVDLLVNDAMIEDTVDYIMCQRSDFKG